MIKEGFIRFVSALLVKLFTYFIVSLVYVFLLLWVGIIKNYNWKYVILLTITLLFFRVFIAEIFVKSEREYAKRKK